MMKKWDPKLTAILTTWAGLAVCLILWVARFVGAEHTLYSWDYLNFWLWSASLGKLVRHDFLSGVWTFAMSLHREYNNVPMAPSALVMALWGSSRLNYVLANVFFWILPALSCAMFLLIQPVYANFWQVVWSIAALFSLMLSPLPWEVTLLGFEDVGGLICVVIVTELFLRTDVRSRNLRRWITIGAVLALLAIFRRWYLFLAIALLLVAAVEATFYALRHLLRTQTISLQSMSQWFFGLMVCVATFVSVYGLITFPLAIRRAGVDYSYQYAAYQHGDSPWTAIAANLNVVVQYFGFGQVILCGCCFVVGLSLGGIRRKVLYLFAPAFVALVFFSRIQTMGTHHALLVYLGMIGTPLVVSKELVVSGGPIQNKWGWVVLCGAVVFAGLGFQTTFSASSLWSAELASVLPKMKVLPKRRHDLPQIEALFHFVEVKVAADCPQPCVYLIASSQEFNSSMLTGAPYSLNEFLPSASCISNTHDVDRRDGFPQELVNARLVLLAVPLQTHLVRNQKVISVPYQLFLSDQGIAKAFVKDPESFNLDDGIRVFAYSRVRSATPEEIANFHDLTGIPGK